MSMAALTKLGLRVLRQSINNAPCEYLGYFPRCSNLRIPQNIVMRPYLSGKSSLTAESDPANRCSDRNSAFETESNATKDSNLLAAETQSSNELISASDDETYNSIVRDMLVYTDFITESEEEDLFQEVEPYLKRLRYETSHWDDAIHGYRETERKIWTQKNKKILERVKALAFPPDTAPMAYVHVLDLQASGVIKPHIDSVRFCGDVIAGMSLLSTSVMRLVNDNKKERYADVLLPRRSLYIMKGVARYDYTHEILAGEKSVYNNKVIERSRRVAVICRNEPSADST